MSKTRRKVKVVISKNPVGRPSRATPETITLLLEAFSKGATVEEACKLAQLGETTFFEWMNRDNNFRSKIIAARNMLDTLAVGNVARAVARGDLDHSRWWIERRMKHEFSTRSEVTGADGKAIEIQWQDENNDTVPPDGSPEGTTQQSG